MKISVYKSGYIKVKGTAFDITGIQYVDVTVKTSKTHRYHFEAEDPGC